MIETLVKMIANQGRLKGDLHVSRGPLVVKGLDK